MNRRQFIGTGVTFATGAGFLGYATMIEPHWLEIVQRDLPIANLPHSLKGATLAQISDLHACSYVSERYLTESLDRVHPFNPDIVILTGDYVTWEVERKDPDKLTQLDRVLSHLPHGRLATIGILGNHDYGQTWKNPVIADRIMPVLRNHGIDVLRNAVAAVQGLDIIGIDELWSGRANTRPAFEQRTNAAAIALCHNPDSLDDLHWEGYQGWVLAGHTHGGQCKPPFLPPPILPVKNRRYSAGEIVVNSERSLYINRGVGHLYQVRFNVRPEITLFTLRAAA
ncbi:MAG: metallophosphoesterase [Gemmatimonadaceae bacterium]